MSDYLNRATTEARKARDAVSAASEHGQKAAEDALARFTKVADRAKDSLESLLAQAKPYIRQARPYLHDANAYYDKTRRRMSGRDLQRPVVLTVASVGAVMLLALLFAPKPLKQDGAADQTGA
jgi:hypothetical protein